ncbi:Maf family protein [Microbulbifer sp. 2201CG32-9]|uniref:Maf family protein n=1 Tax=Microbulbifer sp. 2201CG32-9 TaxID=3232309 RepID=UPI00345BD6E9
MSRKLILASSSPYRRSLLQRLGLSFISTSPDIDETPLAGETPAQSAARLAREKALALAALHPHSLIIGSDQVACCEGLVLGKPGGREKALRQLQFCSGKKVRFHTGLSLLDTSSVNQVTEVETFDVYFRSLSEEQIRSYVEREKPYNCAGSFKVEGLGIVLFEKMEGFDINSLVGLPLIRLVKLLQQFGIDPLTEESAPRKPVEATQEARKNDR